MLRNREYLEPKAPPGNLNSLNQGTLTSKKGEVLVWLTSLYLLVRNQLFQEELKIIFFIFKTT